jgi:hypothetical protein
LIDAIGIIFTLVDLLVIVYIILNSRPHPLIALHALLFWAFVVALNTIQVSIQVVVYKDNLVYLLVHVLLFLYLSLLLMVGTLAFERGDGKNFVYAIEGIPARIVFFCLSMWISFRMYLLFKYGLASFNLLATRDLIDADYTETAISTLLWYLAFGSFLTVVAKMVLNWRTLLNPWLVLPASVFFIFAVVFNELGSARRFLLLLVCLLTLVMHTRQQRILPSHRTVLVAVFCSILVLGIAEYFQQIRHNHENLPEIIPLMNQGEFVEAARLYLTPSVETGNDLATTDNLEIRTGPFQVLFAMTSSQIENATSTHGAVLGQSIINAIPSFFMSNKDYVNADQIIADAFELEDTDLPTGILASFQSDLGFFGYMAAPILFVLLLRTYGKAVVASENFMLRIVFLSVAVLTSSYLEDVPDALLSNARDVAMLILIIFLLGTLKRSVLNIRPPIRPLEQS